MQNGVIYLPNAGWNMATDWGLLSEMAMNFCPQGKFPLFPFSSFFGFSSSEQENFDVIVTAQHHENMDPNFIVKL